MRLTRKAHLVWFKILPSKIFFNTQLFEFRLLFGKTDQRIHLNSIEIQQNHVNFASTFLKCECIYINSCVPTLDYENIWTRK
jgi:hypothetical protein